MSAVLANAVDDVVYALCDDCAATYAMYDGWQGLCPECCALLDDHHAGGHDANPIVTCRGCDVVDDRFELPAIA